MAEFATSWTAMAASSSPAILVTSSTPGPASSGGRRRGVARAVTVRSSVQRRRESLRRRSEAVLFGPPAPQQDIRNAEQLGRERYADLARTSARREELGIQKPKLRESIRHWYRRLTRREPAER